MTKTTETTEWLRNEMYFRLSKIKNPDIDSPDMDCFESAMESYLERLREDRDELRNKLQAFEFANRSAAELLSEALREPSGLRKTVGSMVHQNFAGPQPKEPPDLNAPKTKCSHLLATPGAWTCWVCGGAV
jgi:hypothetical protein